MALSKTRETIWMSKNGSVRLERKRHSKSRSKRQRAKGNYWRTVTAYFLTIKYKTGAGYVHGENRRRGWTFTAGTQVRAYPKRNRGIYYPSVRRFKMRLTRNGNHDAPFYPAWY